MRNKSIRRIISRTIFLSLFSILLRTLGVADMTNHTLVNKTNVTTNTISSTSITVLTEDERIIFFILYLIIFCLSMVANVATICTSFKRKVRLLQKTLIISLALSDIVVCVFFGVNNMINFSHSMMNWILGEFMCSFIPYMQITGSVANSVTMTAIALDRYKNIVYPTNMKWDPNIWLSVALIVLLWGVAAGVSYPMYTLTVLIPVRVLVRDPNNPKHAIDDLNLYMCVTRRKQDHLITFAVMFSLVFLPLMCLFLWFYYKIAQLIWKRRKPASLKFYEKHNNNNSVTVETSTAETKTTSTSNRATPILAQIDKRLKSINKTSKLHMEKKIRTFKIILVIMFVFFLCRMPHWIFSLVKYSKNVNEPIHWVIANALSALLILNTALNPFLYNFLNQTITYLDKFFVAVGDFVSKICCCCCTNTEFDDFEKDNPFAPNLYDQRPSQTSSTIPRGPYMDCVDNRYTHVKFHDVAVVKLYPKENSNCNTY